MKRVKVIKISEEIMTPEQLSKNHVGAVMGARIDRYLLIGVSWVCRDFVYNKEHDCQASAIADFVDRDAEFFVFETFHEAVVWWENDE